MLAAAPAAPVPHCDAAQLRLSDDGGQGAAGTGFLSLALRNAGRRCWTKGYPGVRFVDARGRVVTVRQTREARPTPKRVVLAHRGYAHVLVAAPNANAHGGPCRAYRKVRLIPPDETTALVARVTHGPGCVREIRVSAVIAGRDRIQTG